VKRTLAVLFLMMVTGCETKPPMKAGEQAAPPWGYLDLCLRMPEHFICRPK
jgi:predicted transglutaminase-like cysteine proteinase